MTAVVRVPDQVLEEVKRIAALRGQQAGHLIADAWKEYMANNREQFAADLEQAAKLLRDGNLGQLADFTSRNADERGEAAAARARANRVA